MLIITYILRYSILKFKTVKIMAPLHLRACVLLHVYTNTPLQSYHFTLISLNIPCLFSLVLLTLFEMFSHILSSILWSIIISNLQRGKLRFIEGVYFAWLISIVISLREDSVVLLWDQEFEIKGDLTFSPHSENH